MQRVADVYGACAHALDEDVAWNPVDTEICWSLRNDRPLGAEVVTDPRGKFEPGRHGRRSRESAAEDQSGLNTGARTKPPWQDIVAD